MESILSFTLGVLITLLFKSQMFKDLMSDLWLGLKLKWIELRYGSDDQETYEYNWDPKKVDKLDK
jgi:hypothetical protein